jgi:hypothetical protein
MVLHEFDQEELFHLLYAQIHSKNWYTKLVLYLMLIFIFIFLLKPHRYYRCLALYVQVSVGI